MHQESPESIFICSLCKAGTGPELMQHLHSRETRKVQLQEGKPLLRCPLRFFKNSTLIWKSVLHQEKDGIGKSNLNGNV